LTDVLNGASPADETVTFASGITSELAGAEFANNNTDGRNGQIVIPLGLNTARPLAFDVLWASLINGAPSDVELELRYAVLTPGDTLDGSVSSTLLADVTTVGASDADVLKRSEFTLYIADAVPGDLLVLSFFRDASGGNPDDTLAGSIVVVNQELRGSFWH